jgi:hypothetical protein
MSNYLIDKSNIDKVDFDNIIVGTKIQTSDTNSKHYLYYHSQGLSPANGQGSSPKDIYIRLPKVRLIYNLANSKYNQLSIPLYPVWDELSIMIKFIKKLENYIISKLGDVNEYSNIITKKNKIYFLRTNYGENNIKITSDLKQNKILFSDFKINGEIEMIIKLDYIWVKSKKCGLSINLYQIKYYSPASQNDFDFIDEHVSPNINNYIIPLAPPPPAQLAHQVKTVENNQRLKISSKDLKNAIKKLKPIE